VTAFLRNKGSSHRIDLDDPNTPITLVADQFKSFRENVIPMSASDVQVSEMRRAFYAGAAAVGYIIQDCFAEGLPEEEVGKVLPAIDVEVNRFGAQVLQQAGSRRSKH